MATVLIPDIVAPEAVEELSKRFKVATLFDGHDDYDPKDVVAWIYRFSNPHPDINELPNLKIVVSHGTGNNSVIPKEVARERNICLANAPGKNSLSVAEQTIMFMLALSKSLLPITKRYAAQGSSCRFSVKYNEITGKTLGLVGMGNIGKIVANIATKGFGMKVIAYDPYVTSAVEGVELTDDRSRIFREADYVSLHMPLTDATYHCVGEADFSLMKPTAFIINCSRGGIVDQEAMIRALQDGTIAGAGLDVTEPEDCPTDSPLFGMDNVVLTPHIAGNSREALVSVGLSCAQTICDYLDGKEVPRIN